MIATLQITEVLGEYDYMTLNDLEIQLTDSFEEGWANI